MEFDTAVTLGRQAMYLTLVISAPILIVGALAGLVIGALQSATQIQDQTIGFVVKIVLMLMTFALLLPWLVGKTSDYTRNLWENLPESVTIFEE